MVLPSISITRFLAFRIIGVLSVVSVDFTSATGCEFDCSSSPPQLCGDAVQIIWYPFVTRIDFDDKGHLLEVTHSLNTLDLANRGITSIAEFGLDCYSMTDYDDDFNPGDVNLTGLVEAVVLDNNSLTTVPNMDVFRNVGYISFNGNALTHLPSSIFENFTAPQLWIYFNNNQISSIDDDFLSAYTGNLLWVYLQGNQLSTVPNDMLTNFVGSFLFLFLSNNQIETIPPSTFSGFRGSKIALFFDANNVTSIDDVFKDFVVGGVVTLSLVNNSITATSLASALRSFSSSSATLNLDLYGNNVKSLPDNVFAGIGNNTVPGQSPSIHINLMHNPLAALSTNTFQGGWMNDVSVDLSDTTSDTYIIPPYLAWFNRVESLSLNFSGTAQLMLSDLSAFRDFNGRSLSIDMSRNRLTGVVGDVLPQAPFSVYLNLSYNEFTAVGNHSFQFPGGVDLSHNNISVIQNESFWGSRISSLNISSNAITFVDCAAFNYSFALTDLGLSFNHVSMVTHTFLDNVPALNDFRVDNNAVWALPTTSNHLAGPDKAAENTITCGTYGPAATNCTCAPGLVYSEFCGYGRCMATASGCSEPTPYATPSCSLAPQSVCISGCDEKNSYYEYTVNECLLLTSCLTAFPIDRNASSGLYHKAFEFTPPTSTSNRVCSICATCADGFRTVPCTVTTDSRCLKIDRLNSGDIASIVLAIAVLGATAAVGFWYGRQQWRRGKSTQVDLEIAELLLADVSEENQRMAKAWEINQSDIILHRQLASGAYGTVWAGKWGHISVAVKQLKLPVNDKDPLSSADFDREVKFMKAIKHPNLLIFYGAGYSANGTPFLVVELMELGSMGDLLRDLTKELSWSTRLSFALDIARGMKHLHSLGSLHRDLKSDNCLVDGNFRVKVGDFGNSRLTNPCGNMHPSCNTVATTNLSPTITEQAFVGGKTLTKRVGTPLWMAPELMSDAIALSNGSTKTISDYGPEIDVYSFAIVMWEILARQDPWTEIDARSYFRFITILESQVTAGKRPRIPSEKECTAVIGAPPAYVQLMQSAWAQRPQARPTFVVVTAELLKMKSTKGGVPIPVHVYEDQVDVFSSSSNSSISTSTQHAAELRLPSTRSLIGSLRTSLRNPTYDFAEGTPSETKTHYE
eukprot:m.1306591 g.1306591  ORF g.1306591 m.1306591 type:complete len:1140 (-) comp24816_c0_seq1:94-3513(-)